MLVVKGQGFMQSAKKTVLVALAIASLFGVAAFAKDKSDIKIGINQIISSQFPEIKTYANVIDDASQPIPLLVKSNFTIAVDGKQENVGINIEGFTYTEEGVSYFVLLDTSGVMMGDPIEAQKKAAKMIIEQMRPQDLISLYLYSEKIDKVFEFEKKSDKLYDTIDKVDVEAGGVPKILDQLAVVVKQTLDKKNTLKRNVVILMSEGRDEESNYNEDKVMEMYDEINIPIYAIGIPVPFNDLDRLDRIATHTGGTYFGTYNLSDINKRLQLIEKQILQSYVLKFTVGMRGDNKFHQLQLKLNLKDQETVSTKNFIAKYNPPNFLLMLIIILIVVLILVAGTVFLVITETTKQRKLAGTAQQKKCEKCGRVKKDDWNECLFCKFARETKKKK
jgi:VWFA-related protein